MARRLRPAQKHATCQFVSDAFELGPQIYRARRARGRGPTHTRQTGVFKSLARRHEWRCPFSPDHHGHRGVVSMKCGSAITKAAFMLATSVALFTAASPASAQSLRELMADRTESRGDLRDLILDRLATRQDLRDLLRDRADRRGDLRDLILDRLATREDLRDLWRDRAERRGDLRDLI